VKLDEIGLSASRLERVDHVMKRRYVDSGRLPGLLTMVYRRGKLAHTGMSGHMDVERGKPMREDAIFRIYSMSKPITSVALMMLAEEGLIGLDDDVATHIPSWKNLGVYATGVPGLVTTGQASFLTTPVKRPMKIVDLVTHTSGLTYGFMNRTNVDRAYREAHIADFNAEGGLDAMIQRLSTLPLEFSPGTAWNYSVSIDVMGYLVQKLSGMSFGEFLRTRLFEPLGMSDTAFWCPPEKIDRFTSCYQPDEGGGIKLQDDAEQSTYAAPPSLESGGGGLVSTAHDYMRFCRMMLHGGTLDGVQILSPKTVELFSLNHLPENKELADMAPPGLFSEAGYSGIGFSIGCGVNINVARTRLPGTLGEYFWGGAASTAFWIDPKEELAVVFMTQVLGSDARLTLRRDLRTLVYAAMTESFA
jgi:CubicO group peptidase (beta-lactamase class C family)